MPKHIVSCSAKCPYYRCEERHEIFCQSVADGMATHVAFAVPAEKKAWMNRHCKEKFGDCYLAKALEAASEQQ